MPDWDESVDFVIVGSGGGSMCAALACKDMGKTPLILEKTDKVGGSTAMSGGILWIPNNPLLAPAGVHDTPEMARSYMDDVVGDAPGSSPERKTAYLAKGPEMVSFLQRKGLPFVYCDGWSDYYDDRPGGVARGRSIGMKLYDIRKLGPWKDRLRRGAFSIPLQGNEGRRMMLAKRTLAGFLLALRVGVRMFGVRLFGRQLVGAGAAIQANMLDAALKAGVDIRVNSPVVEFVQEQGRVSGVVVRNESGERRIEARAGVLINAGGFAQNEAMRRRYGPQPSSVEWTHANPGDTGEIIEMAIALGADVQQMEEAVWVPTSLPPGGKRSIHTADLSKPHSILVDANGRRFTDEACSYMEIGQRMYRAGAVPSWAIIESRHRAQYNWGMMAPGITPRGWLDSGYMKKAATLEELARLCSIDPEGLRDTVEQFNQYARSGVDPEFGRGSRAFDRYWGDPTHQPNPCLGVIEKPPFYAVQMYPGDVGTFGGMMTDEFARVLSADGAVIPGLYATGNSTASVMGRAYPGAGASIGASFVFAYIAAQHALGDGASAQASPDRVAASA